VQPLLHKDKELLLHFGTEMLAGLRIAMERAGAHRGIIGIKEKYEDVIQALAQQVPNDVESALCVMSTLPAMSSSWSTT